MCIRDRCELNYTPEAADGSVNISKAIAINGQFLTTKTFWGSLVTEGAMREPSTFINNTPHMAFVRGDANQKFLRERFRLMSEHPFFHDMEHSEDYGQIEQWSPLLIEGRPAGEKIAATYAPSGTDVDFGAVTRQLFGTSSPAAAPSSSSTRSPTSSAMPTARGTSPSRTCGTARRALSAPRCSCSARAVTR